MIFPILSCINTTQGLEKIAEKKRKKSSRKDIFNPHIHLTIINRTALSLEINRLKSHAEKIALVVGNHCLSAETTILNIRLAFLESEEMKNLKKTYKMNENDCDVLSFCEEQEILQDPFDHSPIWGSGDIAICPEIVRQNAQNDGISFGYALLEVIAHGIWHLCGLTHDYQATTLDKLQQQQKKWLIQTLYQDVKHSPEDFLPENSFATQ